MLEEYPPSRTDVTHERRHRTGRRRAPHDRTAGAAVSISAYLAFCGLAVVLAVTPGPDSLLVLRYSVRRVASGMAAAAGSGVGNVLWALLVAIGLAALIEQSGEAYRVLKAVGGAYLVYLGVRALRGPRARVRESSAESVRAPDSAWASFAAGLLSCLFNPKVGLFYLAVVPQFLPKDGSVFGVTLLLGGTLAVIIMSYLAVLCCVAAAANEWLRRPRTARRIEIASGAVLGGLGLGTAVSAVSA